MGDRGFESHETQTEIEISLERYAEVHIKEIITALEQAGANPTFVIVFGSAIADKRLTSLPRWDIDVFILTQQIPDEIKDKLTTSNGKTYTAIIPSSYKSVHFVEYQPEDAIDWKSPRRGLHIQLADRQCLQKITQNPNDKDHNFIHQIFSTGAIIWEKQPGIVQQICQQFQLPLPPHQPHWSTLIIEQQGPGKRII